LFPKKACSVRLHDGDWEATFNGCGELGSLKANLSGKKPVWLDTQTGLHFQAAFLRYGGLR